MTNDELLEDAKKAITALFSDQSVSQSQCRKNLDDLIDEIRTLKDSLDDEDGTDDDES